MSNDLQPASTTLDNSNRPTMKPARWIVWVLLAALTIGIASCVIGVVRNSYAYTEICIELLPDSEEPRDHRALGIFGGKGLPDYTLEALVQGRWVRLGGYENRSAKTPLIYAVSNPIPTHQTQSLRIRDRDFIISDVLDEVPITGLTVDGTLFRFTLTQSFDLQSGLHWFFATSIGKIIAWGVGAAICILILLLLAPILGSLGG